MLQRRDLGLLERGDFHFHVYFPFSGRELESLGPRLPLGLLPEFGRRLPKCAFECTRERFGIFKTCVQRDIRNPFERCEYKPVRCTLEPHQLDIAYGADAAVIGELAVKMKFREVGDFAQVIQGQGFIEMPVDIVEHLVESLTI